MAVPSSVGVTLIDSKLNRSRYWKKINLNQYGRIYLFWKILPWFKQFAL